MKGHEQQGSNEEKAEKWQINVEYGQLDWISNKQLPMRDRSSGNDKIQGEDQEAHPDRRDARGGIVERLLQRLDVVGIDLLVLVRHAMSARPQGLQVLQPW